MREKSPVSNVTLAGDVARAGRRSAVDPRRRACAA